MTARFSLEDAARTIAAHERDARRQTAPPPPLTGEAHTDALSLLDMTQEQRAVCYIELQGWPAAYRDQVFALFDEMWIPELERERGVRK